MNTADLKVICDLVHSLTVLRLQGCSHLCIENYAPELFGKLLDVYRNGGLIVTGSDISSGAFMKIAALLVMCAAGALGGFASNPSPKGALGAIALVMAYCAGILSGL